MATDPVKIPDADPIADKSNRLLTTHAWFMFFQDLIEQAAAAGSVTNAATLTLNRLVIGQGGDAIATLGSLGTTTTVLHGNAAGAPTFGAVALASDVSGDLPYANLVPATAASRVLLRGSAAGAGDWQEGTIGANLTIAGTVLNANATVTNAAALTASQLVLGAGGNAVATLGALGTTTTVLHGNAAGAPSFGAVALTTDVTGVLPIANGGGLSGTYLPTLTNVANLDASTAFNCQYLRVGNVVTVSGKVAVDPTAAGAVQLGISLPIASNFANPEECGGVAFASAIAGQGAAILADATNNRAELQFIAVDLTNQPMWFSFTYQVI